MNFCKDCKHYRPLVVGLIFKTKYHDLAKCNHTLDPVSGQPEKFCEFERKSSGRCGPDGKLWQAA